MKTTCARLPLFVVVALTLGIASAGAQTLYVPGGSVGTVTNGVNGVGVGTSSPNHKLDVGGVANAWQHTSLNKAHLSYYGPSDEAIIGNLVSDWASTIRIGPEAHSFWLGNAARMVVKSSGFVGIGTTNPATPLHVSKAGGGADLGQLARFTDSTIANGIGPLSLTVGTDNHWAYNPGIVLTGSNAISLGVGDGSMLSNQRMLTIVSSGNVGIGTTNPTQKLSVNGTIRAQEVIIEASPWPDDVFAPGYALPTVEEVAAHIDANGHLPGVPSASSVAEEGVALGEMQKTLLRKVEELTLYVISQERRLTAQSAEMEALRSRNNELAVRLAALEPNRLVPSLP